jgi:hypothetical protein
MGLSFMPQKTKDDDKKFLQTSKDLNPIIEISTEFVQEKYSSATKIVVTKPMRKEVNKSNKSFESG